MMSLRWWHMAVFGIVALLAGLLLLTGPSTSDLIGGLASLAAFALAWAVLGRLGFENAIARTIYLPLMTVIVASAAYFESSLATLQCVAFPLLWVMIVDTRRAVIANVVFAFVVGIGITLGTGSVLVGLGIEAASLAFALALGAWFTRIYAQRDERERLLDELRAAQDQLAALNRDSGIASERERLAREIHDTIAQDLTGLVMLTQRARREWGSGDPSATLELLEESARAALAETRALVASGAPVGIAGGDITDALGRLAERFSRETGVTVGVETGMLVPLDRDAEVVLLRVAQESLANVRKHSGAESAVIELDMTDGVRLTVRDDGAGFDASRPATGFGLTGMRERLALVGGSLEVASSPTGTTLIARLPK